MGKRCWYERCCPWCQGIRRHKARREDESEQAGHEDAAEQRDLPYYPFCCPFCAHDDRVEYDVAPGYFDQLAEALRRAPTITDIEVADDEEIW